MNMWRAIIDVSLGTEAAQALQWLVKTCERDFQQLQANGGELFSFFKNGMMEKRKPKGVLPAASPTHAHADPLTPVPSSSTNARKVRLIAGPGGDSSSGGPQASPAGLGKAPEMICAATVQSSERASVEPTVVAAQRKPAPAESHHGACGASSSQEDFNDWGSENADGPDADGDISMDGAVIQTGVNTPSPTPKSPHASTRPNRADSPVDPGLLGKTTPATTPSPPTPVRASPIPPIAVLTADDLAGSEGESDLTDLDAIPAQPKRAAHGPLRSSARVAESAKRLTTGAQPTHVPPAKKRKIQAASKQTKSARAELSASIKQEELFWASTSKFGENAVNSKRCASI